jgi:hypothetical protein
VHNGSELVDQSPFDAYSKSRFSLHSRDLAVRKSLPEKAPAADVCLALSVPLLKQLIRQEDRPKSKKNGRIKREERNKFFFAKLSASIPRRNVLRPRPAAKFARMI